MHSLWWSLEDVERLEKVMTSSLSSSVLLNALFLYPTIILNFLSWVDIILEGMSIVQVPPFTDEKAQASSYAFSMVAFVQCHYQLA